MTTLVNRIGIDVERLREAKARDLPPLNCGTCSACCRDDLIVLHPDEGDDPGRYLTREIFNPVLRRVMSVLERKPDGTCVYLRPNGSGCSIYADRPVVCRSFDCRRLYLAMTRAERRRAVREGAGTTAVFDAGRERLDGGE